MEQTRYAYEATLARIKRLEANLRMHRDGRLKLRLEATKIRAPVTGTILTKKAEKGNIVNPSAFSSGISASLCEMADLTHLEVDLSVQERDIASVKVGQQCWILPEA